MELSRKAASYIFKSFQTGALTVDRKKVFLLAAPTYSLIIMVYVKKDSPYNQHLSLVNSSGFFFQKAARNQPISYMQLAVTSRAKYNKRYLYSIAAISVRQNDFIVGGGRWKEDPNDFSFRVPFVTELLRFNFFSLKRFYFF